MATLHRQIKGGINSNDRRDSRTTTSIRLRKERKESQIISRRQVQYLPAGAEDGSETRNKSSFVSISDVGEEKWLIAGLHTNSRTNVATLLACIRGCRTVLHDSTTKVMKCSSGDSSDENAIPNSNTILHSLCNAIPRLVTLLEFPQENIQLLRAASQTPPAASKTPAATSQNPSAASQDPRSSFSKPPQQLLKTSAAASQDHSPASPKAKQT
jgi:hypothetical protein